MDRRPPFESVPDAVATLVISRLVLRTYATTCRVSRRFRGLTRLPAAAPADVRIVFDSRAGGASCAAERAWVERMAPRAVSLDLRDQLSSSTADRDVVDHVRGLVARHALCAAVAKCARTLRLVGPFLHESNLWAQLRDAGVLTRLELHMPTSGSFAGRPIRLPDEIGEIASLRALTCSGRAVNALEVAAHQLARMSQLTELAATSVVHDYGGGGVTRPSFEKYAADMALKGNLRHLRLRDPIERDMAILADTVFRARLETLYLPADGRVSLRTSLRNSPETLLPALRRFETTWLSDPVAQLLARCAPNLVALELRPTTQWDAKLIVQAARIRHAYPYQRRVFGVIEPPAGAGLMRSLARHLPHLRELVLRRHHADLRPLSALTVLTKLVCCDFPRATTVGVQQTKQPNGRSSPAGGGTQWPDSLPALVEMRVMDITHETCRVANARRVANAPGRAALGVSVNVRRREMLYGRFPTLAYLRFTRVEDEPGADEGDGEENDDDRDPDRRDPENGFCELPPPPPAGLLLRRLPSPPQPP